LIERVRIVSQPRTDYTTTSSLPTATTSPPVRRSE
jgi:hypothetical protein